MDKKDYTFKDVENVPFFYDGKSISVKPFLSVAEQKMLIDTYLESYFSGKQTDVFTSEIVLMMTIVDMCTDADSKILIDQPYHIYKIMEFIERTVINYNSFRFLLNSSVENRKREISEENSFENKIVKALKELGEKMTPEMIEEGKELLRQLENSSVAKNVIKDSKRGTRKIKENIQ